MGRKKTSSFRKLAIYGFELVQGGHCFHALLDFDITGLRTHLREKRRSGGGGSLFAFLLKAIAISLAEYPELNSMVDHRKTTIFDKVDINVPIEVEVGGNRNPRQCIIRDSANKTIQDIEKEITEAKENITAQEGFVFSKALRTILSLLPKSAVLLLFRTVLRNHSMVMEMSGTVFVTSITMFSNLPGYAIPYAGGPKAVSFAIGSASQKPMVRNGTIEIREMLSLTATFNHDAVDGAPAARFLNTLRKWVERDYRSLL